MKAIRRRSEFETRAEGRGRRSPRARVAVEALEGRRLLATFAVTNLQDGGAGSLRQAIVDARDKARR